MTNRGDVTLSQLRYFVAAAVTGTMTGAAREFGVAQSAVSTAIAGLEAQIGAQLFVRRHARGLVPTAAGEQLLKDARWLLSELEGVIDVVRGTAAKPHGTVRVACFTTLVPFFMPRLLIRLALEYPGLEVDVIETDAEGADQVLRSGAAELAITYDFGFSGDISTARIGSARPYLVVAEADVRPGQTSAPLEELVERPFVLLDMPRSREHFLSLFHSRGLVPNIAYRTTSYETARALVGRGLGFSILHQRPQSSTAYDGGHVSALDISDDVDELPYVVARLKDVRRTARAKAVEDMVLSDASLRAGGLLQD
ncbi:LysR family transcriptional regulator [Cryobacterium tepidiphilum]|uniref:LysR family transcriptional regulator n=1 Tax=Cryobacterium tepidiphilum TaxID=2486026 RepID=A0A3M8L9P9_9MICO|nr:LysR family transcriptional regulator [Cryobacterium tepidiphilum]RNE62221.1 LysR family transcriptional regulator [Cryobacterium tepidiphilum]